jgi:hypothetical protein
VRKGLVVRAADPGDRRTSTLALTPEGVRIAQELASADQVLVASAAALPAGEQDAAVRVLLDLIAAMLDRGVIDVARTCTTCRYFRSDVTGSFCDLLDVALSATTLRADCPDHRPRSAPATA